MKKYLLLLFIGILHYAHAQNKFVRRNYGCLYGESEASITRTGASGSFYLQNTCNNDMYFSSCNANIEILEETYDKTTGKRSSKWITKKLSYNNGIFMRGGSSARQTLTGKDNNVMSALANQENYYTDLRLPDIVLGEGSELNNNKPNENCVLISYTGRTELFEKDGLKFYATISRSQSDKVNGFYYYDVELHVFNSNMEKVKFTGSVLYNVYMSGIRFSKDADFNKVKPNDSEFRNFHSPLTNLDHTFYIEITKIPTIEGLVSQSSKTTQTPAKSTTTNTTTTTTEVKPKANTTEVKETPQNIKEPTNTNTSTTTTTALPVEGADQVIGTWRITGWSVANNAENGPFLNVDPATAVVEYTFNSDGTCIEKSCYSKRKIANKEFEYTFSGTWKINDKNIIEVFFPASKYEFQKSPTGNLVRRDSGNFEKFERYKP